MPHVSTDGLARPPYVNVAFQQEEIRMRRGAVGYHCHMCTLIFIFSSYLKDECSWIQIA